MTAAERFAALPPAPRQLLAAALLAASLALAWYAVLKPLHRLLASQEVWRAQVRRDLAESRGKAAIESQLVSQLEVLHGVPLWKSFYSGPTEEEANAEIEQDLRSLGAASGVPTLALTPLPKKNYPDYIAHGVRLNAAMTAEQLKRFSAALRAAPHFLRVERFAASAPQTQPPGQNPPLTVTMNVYGYSRAAAATNAAPEQPPTRGGS